MLDSADRLVFVQNLTERGTMSPRGTSAFSQPLTPEEDARQKVATDRFHDLVIEVLQDIVEDVSDEQLGLMVSGGVDSTALACALIEIGRKPTLFTYYIEVNPFGNHGGRDMKMARRFAEHYNLELVEVPIKDDPDYVAREFEAIGKHLEIETHPDFTVGYLYREITRAAKNRGITLLMNGLDPSGPSITEGEEIDKRGMYGKMSVEESNALMVSALSSSSAIGQAYAFSRFAKEIGVEMVSPYLYVGMLLPLRDLSFREQNRPRSKWSVSRPWEKYLDEANVLPIPSSMQKGSSGGSEFFKRVIPSSPYAAKLLGLQEISLDRPVDAKEAIPSSAPSALKLSGFLRSRREQESGIVGKYGNIANGAAVGQWPVFRAITMGEPLPEKYKSAYPMTEDGSYTPPETDSFGIFGTLEADDETVGVSAAGNEFRTDSSDPRTDHMGRPLHTGFGASCPRARAGLYSVSLAPNVEDRVFDLYASDAWPLRLQLGLNIMDDYVEELGGIHEKITEKWQLKAIDEYNSVSTLIEETRKLWPQIQKVEDALDEDPRIHELPWVISEYADRVGKSASLDLSESPSSV